MSTQSSGGSNQGKALPKPKRIARFEVQTVLGGGAFGVVFRAYDPQLEREVAVKVPRPGTLTSPKRVERFLGDAKSAARLRHPHIVPVYDCGRDGELIYIAAAYVRGQTLAEAVDAGPLDPRRAATVVMKLAEALAYAHANGIVHRDVKPLNVMLDEQGEPHLIDFGLAQRDGDTEPGRMVLGTPAYMSPEQAAGNSAEAAPAFDQYALGVTLYELLTGRTPFSGPSKMQQFHAVNTPPPPPLSINPTLPLDLALICLKALHKHPENRYPNCAAMATDLRTWLAGGVPSVRTLSPRERLARWVKTEPKLAAAVGAVGLLVIMLAVVGIAFGAVSAKKNRELAAANTEAKGSAEQARKAEGEAVISARAATDNAQKWQNAKVLADSNAQKAAANERDAIAKRAAATFDKAVTLGEQGEVGQCLTELANALKLAEDAGDTDLAAVVRQNLAGWRRQAHRLAATRPADVSPTWLSFHPAEPTTILFGGTTASGHSRVLSCSLNAGAPAAVNFPAALPLRTAAVGPDSRLLLTVSVGGLARAFDTATGGTVGELIRPPAGVSFLSAAVFPGGERIVLGGDDGRVYTFALAGDGWVAGPVASHTGGVEVRAVAVDPTGKWVLSGAVNATNALGGQVVLWNATELTPIHKLAPVDGALMPVTAVAFSPRGGTFATGHGTLLNGEARVWDVRTGALRQGGVLRHQSEVYAVAFSPDGRFLATASQDRSARVFDGATLTPVGQPLWHRRDVRAVAFSPDSRRLVTAGDERALRIWELAPGPTAKPPLQLDDAVLAVTTHQPSQQMFTGGLFTGRTWNPRTLEALKLPENGPGSVQLIRAATYDPKGEFLLLGSGPSDGEGRAVLFNKDGQRVSEYAHPKAVLAVAFHPDGTQFATGCADGVVRVYDRTAPDQAPVALAHGKGKEVRVYAVRFSPDRKHLLTGGTDGRAVLWDLTTGKPLAGEMQHPDAVLAAAFSVDGRRIVTGYAGAALVWDWPPGGSPKPAALLPHGPAGIAAVDIAPGGTVLTGGTDGTARWWDPKTRKPLGPVWRPGPTAKNVAFWADGRMMVAGTDFYSGRVMVIEKPPAVTESAADVALWVRTCTGIGTELTVLTPDEWQAEQKRAGGAEPEIERVILAEAAPAAVAKVDPAPVPVKPPLPPGPLPRPPPPGDFLTPFAGLGADFDTLVHIRVKTLLASDVGEKHLKKMVNDIATVEPLRSLLGSAELDPSRDIDEVAVVVSKKDGDGKVRWAALARGTFPDPVKLAGKNPPAGITKRLVAKRGVWRICYTLASGREVWLRLDDKTMVAAGDADTLDAILDPEPGAKPPPPLARARAADPKAAVIAVLATEVGSHPFLDAPSPGGFPVNLTPLMRATSTAVLEVTAAKDLDVTLRLTPRKAETRELEKAAVVVKQDFRFGAFVGAHGAKKLGEFWNSLRVTTPPKEMTVVVTGKLTGEAIGELIGLVK